MNEVEKLLVRRCAEILLRRDVLTQELAELEKELDQVSAAGAAIDLDVEGEARSATFLPHHLRSEAVLKAPAVDITIKEAALRILKNKEEGLTANEILERMREDFGLDYPRSSLSPQLSRLKAEGEIDLKSGRWFLRKPETAAAAQDFKDVVIPE